MRMFFSPSNMGKVLIPANESNSMSRISKGRVIAKTNKAVETNGHCQFEATMLLPSNAGNKVSTTAQQNATQRVLIKGKERSPLCNMPGTYKYPSENNKQKPMQRS